MESLATVCEALHRSLLAYGLSPEQTEAIGKLGHLQSFTAGEHLIMLGSREADMYVIVEGRVEVLTNDSDKLAELGAGAIVGEIAFVDAGPRHAHVVAAGYVTVVRFPAKELRAQLCADKTAGFIVLTNLARLLASRLRNADGRLDQLLDHHHDVWKLCE